MPKVRSKKIREPLGFTPAHFGLIAGCLSLLLFFSFVKGNLTLEKLLSLTPLRAQSTESFPTYEEILAGELDKARAEYKIDEQVYEAEQDITNQKLSLIDSNFAAGNVLGANTQIPDVSEVFDQEQLASIKVRTTTNSSKEALDIYASQMTIIESLYDSLGLVSAVGSEDQLQLKDAQTRSRKLISELQAVEVPLPMVEYHKMKLLYYSTIATMADQRLQADESGNVSQAGLVFLSLLDRINALQQDLVVRYGVEL